MSKIPHSNHLKPLKAAINLAKRSSAHVPIHESKPRMPDRELHSAATPAMPHPDNRHYGTIGIVAHSPQGAIVMAELGKQIVQAGSEIGILSDSDHPNTLQAYHPHLREATKVVDGWGCDFLITTRSNIIIEQRWDKESQIFKDVALHHISKMGDLAKSIVNEAITGSKWRMDNVNIPREWTDIELPMEVEDALRLNAQKREEATDREECHNQFALLIIGGAGPMAGHQLMQDFIERENSPVIHMAMNGCPGKYPYTSGQGPSFLTHLSNVATFLGRYCERILTACNTNHIVMNRDLGGKRSGWLPKDMQPKVIHFGHVLAKALESSGSKVARFVLFATTSTVESGLYKDAVPNLDRLPEEDQGLIMRAIYDVKAGDMAEARKKFLYVASRVPKGTKIIAACTEVMLPFRMREGGDSAPFLCVVEKALDYYAETSQTPKKSPEDPYAERGSKLGDKKSTKHYYR